MTNLILQPITLKEANRFVADYHRHHKPVTGCKFCIGLNVNGKVVGVAIVGRPVARMLDDGWTAEVLRCCTNGIKNGCSMLYGACWRAARAMGYRRLITYILDTEPGISLQASGWQCLGQAGGGSWHRENRPRVDTHPINQKILWERRG